MATSQMTSTTIWKKAMRNHTMITGKILAQSNYGPKEAQGGPGGPWGAQEATSQILEKDGSLKIVIFVLTLY